MNKRIKVLIASLLFFLPFWWGVNVLNNGLEEFWYLNKITNNPHILNAQASESFVQLRLTRVSRKKAIEDRLNNLQVEAESALLIDLDLEGNISVIFEKDSNNPRPIASITKLMTALVVFEFEDIYDFSQVITISEDLIKQDGFSRYGNFEEGDMISVGDILHKALIESNNNAARILTKPIGKDNFIDLMNLEAKKIGLKNTHFINVTGLDSGNGRESNISTANDLAKLAEYILKNYPEIFEITKKTNYTVFNSNGTIHHFIPENTNILLQDYQSIIGGKTGWTLLARGCLLVVLEKPNNQGYYISIVLGTENRSGRFEEIRKMITLFE